MSITYIAPRVYEKQRIWLRKLIEGTDHDMKLRVSKVSKMPVWLINQLAKEKKKRYTQYRFGQLESVIKVYEQLNT